MTPFYEDRLSTLYNGDCIDIMRQMVEGEQRVDKIITSPPYNIIRPNSTDRGYDLYKDGMSNSEYVDWTIDIFKCYDKILNANGCIAYNLSYGTENTEAMSQTVAAVLNRTNFTLADIIVWKKSSATPNNVSANKMTRICEFVYIFCRRNEFGSFTANKRCIGKRNDTGQLIYENVYNFVTAPNNDGSTELNKATFSTKFVKSLMDRYVLQNDVVLDNFSGTGTTLVACRSKGIKAIGIELSKAQCDYSIQRLQKGVQMTLF